MQILQLPDKITFLYLRDHEFRQVRMNRPHPAEVTPSWYGDSVGYYEGDTLVIDTVGIKTDRPLAMLDMYGTPYSRALHVVERYRLLDYEAAREALERDAKEYAVIPNTSMQRDGAYRGKHLQLLFTVDDPGVLTVPWSATITYARPSGAWVEDVCAEGTANSHTPPESKTCSRLRTSPISNLAPARASFVIVVGCRFRPCRQPDSVRIVRRPTENIGSTGRYS